MYYSNKRILLFAQGVLMMGLFFKKNKTYLLIALIAGSILFYKNPATALGASFDRIVNKYNINPKSCSPKIKTSQNMSVLTRDLACFATDNTRILHVSGHTFQDLKKKVEPAIQAALAHIVPFIEFSAYDAREKKYVNQLIFCQEHDEISQKNSLLLALYLLQISTTELSLFNQMLFASPGYRDNSSSIPDALYNKIKTKATAQQSVLASALPIANEYLIATLLGMPDQDIKFLYQRHFFISIDNPTNIERPTTEQEASHTGIWYDPLEVWPKEKREAFKKYIESSDQWNLNFNSEKNAAKEWLAKYSSFSRAELRAGVDLLTSLISWHQSPKKYAKKPHIRKILDTSLKLLNLIGASSQEKTEKKRAITSPTQKPFKKAWVPKEEDEDQPTMPLEEESD